MGDRTERCDPGSLREETQAVVHAARFGRHAPVEKIHPRVAPVVHGRAYLRMGPSAPQRTGRYTQAWSAPSRAFSIVPIVIAALISPTCVYACGKLPSSSPVSRSTSSLKSPRGLA